MPRRKAFVWVMVALYAVLMLAATYLIYKFMIEPAREPLRQPVAHAAPGSADTANR